MDQKARIHFLHIRKTGGTAIKDALQPVANEYGIILHDHLTRLSDVPFDHNFFFFLRHPLYRFISSFYSRLRRGLPRYPGSPWSEAERAAFAVFGEANDLAEGLSSVNPAVVGRAQAAMRGISHINAPYTCWFSSTREIEDRLRNVLLLGLQEQLDADFELLKLKLGLPATLTLPKDDLRAHRTPSSFNKRLSFVGETNIKKWFAEDLAFYEACLKLRSANKLGSEK